MSKCTTNCKYCGKRIHDWQREFRGQVAHTTCILNQPFDLEIHAGTYHAKVHSELIPRKNLQKVLRLVQKCSK